MIRTLWRFVRGALLAALAFALLFPPLYNLVVPEQRADPVALPLPPPGSYRVFVADWGYHTSIIVEQPAGWTLGPPGKERAPFLEYSWGDRLFYMGSDYLPQAVFATLVLPTPTVAYLDGWSSAQFRGARSVYARTIDAATTRDLLIDLERTFRRADGIRLVPYPHGVGLRWALLSFARPLFLDTRLQLVDGHAPRVRTSRWPWRGRVLLRTGCTPTAWISPSPTQLHRFDT